MIERIIYYRKSEDDRVAEAREYIVRCMDCAHARGNGRDCWHFSHDEQRDDSTLEEVPAAVEPDGFCAWGERRA